MNRIRNIFFNVVTSENLMTELFCNLFKFKTFRDAVLELCLQKDQLNRIEFDHLDTQHSLPDDKGRPDLAIMNEEFEILFEIKTGNTNLTVNQPNGYLEHLRDDFHDTKWLILLVPHDYSFLGDWSSKIDVFLKRYPNSGIQTKVISWKDIMNTIEHYDLPILSGYFEDFLGLLKMWFELQNITFNASEVILMFKKDIPEILSKLFAIVDVVKNFNSKDFSVSQSKTSSEYGAYFKTNEGESILYFGVWYKFWREYQKPLCFGVKRTYPDKVRKKFSQLHEGHIIDFHNWRLSWIEQDILSKNNCSEIIAKLIEKELKQLIQALIR